MAEFFAQVQLGALRPVDDVGRELLARRHGKTVRVDMTEPRNSKQLRLYWALVNLIFKHQSRYTTPERLSSALKKAVGAYDEFQCLDGTVITEVHSIRYGSMSQEEFQIFLDRVMEVIVTVVIPGAAKSDLRRELEEITGVVA